MKVACIQISTKDNIDKNVKKLISLINEAIKRKSDLIITPEASTILTDDKKLLLKKSFRMADDPFLKQVSQISKKHKKWILIGSIFIKENNILINRSIIFDKNGKIANYYDKINMFDVKLPNGENYNESKYFKAGSKIKTVDLPWGKLGMTICYDLRFPELYRKLSKKNTYFITVPSAFTKFTGKKHWLTLLKARAIENFCYIFAPNQTGKNTIKRSTYGHSVIISPDGKILKIKKSGEGIIYANINPNQSKVLRQKIPSLMKI